MPGLGHDVVCVGILVADLFVPPMPRLPAAGELLQVSDMLLSTGGCAANTAIDLVKLEARAAVVGRVGQDAFADFIRSDLEQKGVDASGLRTSATASTSRTVILPVVGEDRRYIHAIGANAELRASDVDLTRVAQSRVLYVGGYLLMPGFDQPSLRELFRFARQEDVKTVLDVAGVDPSRGLEPVRQVLPLCDVFLPNDDEARLLTGERDPIRQARALLECGVDTAVVTLGADGVVACTRDQCLRAPAFRVDAVDASGGGDAFDAGFIIGLLQGWDLPHTIEFASAIGASACAHLGTTAGVSTRREALEFLAQNPLPVETVAL